MSVIRTVLRAEKRYFYLVQTYRWAGQVGRKERYLGSAVPKDLQKQYTALDHAVWEATRFPLFREIQAAYRANRQILPKSVGAKELEDFTVEFTYDTNRIEGSTLTFQETSDLLTHGVSPGSRPMTDVRESLAHAALVRRLLADPEPIDLQRLLNWHKSIFGETKPDIAGRLRDFEVRIRGSNHVPPPQLDVRPMLIELLRRLRRKGAEQNPVETAGSFHFQFENIHPFGDGNGRIGRLAMNMILFQAGYPMINIRYGKRSGYYRALERSNLASSPRPFLMWFFRTYRAEQQRWCRPRKATPTE